MLAITPADLSDGCPGDGGGAGEKMNHESQTVSAVAEQWKQVLSDLLYVDSVRKTFCTYTYLHTIQRDFN